MTLPCKSNVNCQLMSVSGIRKIVRCSKQFTIGRVVKLSQHITVGIGHCPHTAKMVGNVIVGLPTAIDVCYPTAGNGKALGYDVVATINS